MNQLFNLIHLVEKEGKRSLKMAAVFKEQHNTIQSANILLLIFTPAAPPPKGYRHRHFD